MTQQNKQMHHLALFLVLTMLAGLLTDGGTVSAAAARLNKKVISVKAGKVVTLRVKNGKEKARWTVKSGKRYVKLINKKRYSVRIRAIKKGTAKI